MAKLVIYEIDLAGSSVRYLVARLKLVTNAASVGRETKDQQHDHPSILGN